MIFRVFDPMPVLTPGSGLEFSDGKYHVTKNQKVLSMGDVIEVDEDLMVLKHCPEKLVIAIARIRKLIREKRFEDLVKTLPEENNGHSINVPSTTQG